MEENKGINSARVVYVAIEELSKGLAQGVGDLDWRYLQLYGEFAWFNWYYNYAKWGDKFKGQLSDYVIFKQSLALVNAEHASAILSAKSYHAGKELSDLRTKSAVSAKVDLLWARKEGTNIFRLVREKQEYIKQLMDGAFLCIYLDYLDSFEDSLNEVERLTILRSLRISLLNRLLCFIGVSIDLPQSMLKQLSGGDMHELSFRTTQSLLMNAIEAKLFFSAVEVELPIRTLCDFFAREYAMVSSSFHQLLHFAERAVLMAAKENCEPKLLAYAA
ncbi:MAG: hypothetical protein ACOX8U_00500 [Bradymonadia bacterium]